MRKLALADLFDESNEVLHALLIDSKIAKRRSGLDRGLPALRDRLNVRFVRLRFDSCHSAFGPTRP
jgi:hypothetical protein